jgi:molybdopterin-guanine dinucleotide biosynthesis protein A
MGEPKAWLPFGNERMLPRIVRILGEAVEPIIVAAAAAQDLPALPKEVIVVRDEEPAQGPLQGILSGLTAIKPFAGAAYVTSCDVPLLSPEFVRYVISRLGEHEIAIPRDDQFHHPLAAVYRCDVAVAARRLVQSHRLRPVFLLEACSASEIPVDDLRAVDPDLHSLLNLNHPQDYVAALKAAGFGR